MEIHETSLTNEHVILGKDSKIWKFCNIYGTKEAPVKIGNNTQIGSYTEIKPDVEIGDNCRIQSYVFIPSACRIGNNVFIAPRVTFLTDKYPTIKKTLDDIWEEEGVIIENNVTLGGGSIICPGVNINNNAFIGAGSIVTKNVDSYSIIIGNPARKIGDVRDDRYKRLIIH